MILECGTSESSSFKKFKSPSLSMSVSVSIAGISPCEAAQ